jgi:hypothetical protein
MGNRSSSAADAGVLQVSTARAAEIHPDVAALARLPASRPIVSAAAAPSGGGGTGAGAGAGSGGRAASQQQSAVQSPPPRASISSSSSFSSSSASPSLPTSAETSTGVASAAAAHSLRLDPACVQALHDRVRSHLATSVDGILVSQHDMNDRVRALQSQSQAVASECTAAAADVDAFSAQLDARTIHSVALFCACCLIRPPTLDGFV